MNIDTYLLMGEKEFFDKMKDLNKFLTSKERHILVVVAERFKENKEDIVCPYVNILPYKEQRTCQHFEQAGDDYNNEWECTNCLIGRSTSMLCELKMTQQQIEEVA